jgi:hypothetical protein
MLLYCSGQTTSVFWYVLVFGDLIRTSHVHLFLLFIKFISGYFLEHFSCKEVEVK